MSHVVIREKRIIGRENRQCKHPMSVSAWLVCGASTRLVVEESDGSCIGTSLTPILKMWSSNEEARLGDSHKLSKESPLG